MPTLQTFPYHQIFDHHHTYKQKTVSKFTRVIHLGKSRHSKKQRGSQLQTITKNSKKNEGMKMIKQRNYGAQWNFQATPIQKLPLYI